MRHIFESADSRSVKKSYWYMSQSFQEVHEQQSYLYCHQQPAVGNESGFYKANHMMDALRILDVENPKEFEVSTAPLDKDELLKIQEKNCFIHHGPGH